MPVVALITKPQEVEPVIKIAMAFAKARDTSFLAVCWSYATDKSSIEVELTDVDPDDQLLIEVVDCCESCMAEDAYWKSAKDIFQVLRARSMDKVATTLAEVVDVDADLLVAAAENPNNTASASYIGNPLLRQSPCNTLIVYHEAGRSLDLNEIFVAVNDRPHDQTAVSLALGLSRSISSHVTVATVESEEGDGAVELGERELARVLRNAGASRQTDSVTSRVYFGEKFVKEAVADISKTDLHLMPANNTSALKVLLRATKRPTLCIVKRAPPLKKWWKTSSHTEWIPRLSPADYADLVQGLRTGSRCSVDFLIMLGLAAAVASLGLLQDSPAVVIGSMLLAPLMTPMIGCGLALAQGNARLAKSSVTSIGLGFLLALLISFIIGLITPGHTITQQVAARGDPNLLDLGIAFCSALAAAYALARPNLLGAVAGVAIATAIVPPLCSVGISIAYGEWLNGLGGTVLFLTNAVAIVLGAALTFRILGVTTLGTATATVNRWVYQTFAVLAITMVILAVPLERSLIRQIDLGKPQPIGFPLPRHATTTLSNRLKQEEDVDIILAARPSVEDAVSDAVIWLVSPEDIDPALAEEVRQIMRDEFDDQDAVIIIHAIKGIWSSRK